MAMESKKKIEAEVKILEKELKTEIPRALKVAVAMGDLKENAEYHAAKERQDFLQARISQLRKRLSDLSMINLGKIPRDRISLGSTVKLFDVEKEKEVIYKLMTTEDVNLSEGTISTTSPIGRSLLGKQDGDTVNVRIPAGARSFEVISFTTIHDD